MGRSEKKGYKVNFLSEFIEEKPERDRREIWTLVKLLSENLSKLEIKEVREGLSLLKFL